MKSRGTSNPTSNKASTLELPSPVPDDDDKPLISLENFNQQSEDVTITEPESIEALKRIGYNAADLNFKPLIKFKRPGCDDTVTQLLFKKNQQKRENVFKQALEIRSKIFEEKKDPPQETAIIRKTKQQIQQDKESISHMQNDQNSSLRKLVLMQLRQLFITQQHQSAVEKTNSRIQAIEEEQKIRITKLRARPLSPSKSPQLIDTPPKSPTLPYIDASQERIAKMRKEEAEKRQERILKMENHLQSVAQRSEKLLQQQTEARERKINSEMDRFTKWEQSRAEALNNMIARCKSRTLHAQSVLQARTNNDEERKQQILQKIMQSEARIKTSQENRQAEVQKKIDILRAKTESRLQHARETREKQQQEADQQKLNFTKQDEELKQKILERQKAEQLKLMEKQLDREEKAERAIRSTRAREYMREKKFVTEKGDPVELEKLDKEKTKIEYEKQNYYRKYATTRDALLQELSRMNSPDDKRSLDQIKKILGMNDDEMEKLINDAKVGIETNHPPSALKQNSERKN